MNRMWIPKHMRILKANFVVKCSYSLIQVTLDCLHWNGGGYFGTVDIRKYVASSKENGNLSFFRETLYVTYERDIGHKP